MEVVAKATSAAGGRPIPWLALAPCNMQQHIGHPINSRELLRTQAGRYKTANRLRNAIVSRRTAVASTTAREVEGRAVAGKASGAGALQGALWRRTRNDESRRNLTRFCERRFSAKAS
eukprot:3761316-Pleurochrysis_carterae.AAC.2